MTRKSKPHLKSRGKGQNPAHSDPLDGNAENRKVELVAQPQEFFFQLVHEAMKHQRVRALPETEFYLVNLLNRFMTTESLYARNSEGGIQEQPLALRFKEALDEPRPEQQKALLRSVGDFSLYVAGYFQESLTRKRVDVDYYIGMGGTAYQHTAARSGESAQKSLFGELAEKFRSFVDVLAEVSESTFPRTEKDILRLYDVWVQTRSERAAQALRKLGILPNSLIKKSYQ